MKRTLVLVPIAILLIAGGVTTVAQSKPPPPVTLADGSPVARQDPANQPPPNSLTVVGGKAKPSDVTDPAINSGKSKPAKDLKGAKRKVAPAELLDESSARGGCTAGYGGGAACLPEVPPSSAEHAGHGMKILWTCTEARTILPRGIEVTGGDKLKLDSNKDGTACGVGDK